MASISAAKASAAFAHKVPPSPQLAPSKRFSLLTPSLPFPPLSQKELAAAAPTQQQRANASLRRARPGRVLAVATPARAPRAPASTGSVRF